MAGYKCNNLIYIRFLQTRETNNIENFQFQKNLIPSNIIDP